jgi:hypothetical protein
VPIEERRTQTAGSVFAVDLQRRLVQTSPVRLTGWPQICLSRRTGGRKELPLIHYLLRRQIELRLRKLFEGSAPLSELDQAAAVWHENEQKKKLQKTLLTGVRCSGGRRRGESFSEYFQSIAAGYPLRLIQEVISVDQPDVKALAWSLDPTRFPHFTAFAELFAYSHYDAEQNQNSPLDWNWQSDAEQLCFLVDVDLIVSADQQFMRRAFDELWKPKGKRMLTPEEFVELL